jgi:hypothetical protein
MKLGAETEDARRARREAPDQAPNERPQSTPNLKCGASSAEIASV